jgi:hypothetical protein
MKNSLGYTQQIEKTKTQKPQHKKTTTIHQHKKTPTKTKKYIAQQNGAHQVKGSQKTFFNF